jgi:gamma-polyglutamate synthase
MDPKIRIFLELLLLGGFLAINYVIYRRHCQRRAGIKIRVHVNGTRGKSSVARLIAAGLRQAGIRTIAKATGTTPAIIYPDGSEKIILRRSEKGSILEHILLFREAVACGAQAVVAECNALQANMQKISEDQLMCSTLGVITNVRPDHLDVMGPTIWDVAEALSLTIPHNATLVAGDKEFAEFFEKKSAERNTKFVPAPDASTVTNEMMSGLQYLEHRENVALALAVCKELGVAEDVALKGMYGCGPDAGVLCTYKIREQDKYVEFINALATNDPFSLLRIWQRMMRKIGADQLKIMLINCRRDRYSRSQQLVSLVSQELPTDYCVLIGEGTSHVAASMIRHGLNESKILNLGVTSPEFVFRQILELTKKDSVVFAIGNIADRHKLGINVVEYFKERNIAK